MNLTAGRRLAIALVGVLSMIISANRLCHVPLDWAWFVAMTLGWAAIVHSIIGATKSDNSDVARRVERQPTENVSFRRTEAKPEIRPKKDSATDEDPATDETDIRQRSIEHPAEENAANDGMVYELEDLVGALVHLEIPAKEAKKLGKAAFTQLGDHAPFEELFKWCLRMRSKHLEVL